MSNTQALTLSARIAELERIARNGEEARNTLKRLYVEQDKVAEAIEDTQNVIYAGEDADATLSRLTAVLDAPTTEEARPAIKDVLTDMLPPVGEPESTPGLQIGEVLVVGSEELQAAADEPAAPVAAPRQPQTASEAAQAERQPALLADLTAHPASSSREVQARLGWALSTTSNWLTKLVVEGLLTVDQEDYPYRYSVAGQEPEKKVEEELPPASEPEQAAPAAPRPSASRDDMVAYLAKHGPQRAKVVATALGLHVGPCAVTLNALVRAGQLTTLPGGQPVVYAIPSTALPVPTEAASTPATLHAAPDQAALNTTMRANAALVLGLLEPGQEYKETDLLTASGLPISHLRLALGNLQATGQVQRLEGVTPMARATFRLEQLDLPVPDSDTLTPDGERVAAHLAHVTARSERDTASNLASGLGLARAVVDQALAVLNAQGRLAYSRVGNLVMYTLKAPSEATAAD